MFLSSVLEASLGLHCSGTTWGKLPVGLGGRGSDLLRWPSGTQWAACCVLRGGTWWQVMEPETQRAFKGRFSPRHVAAVGYSPRFEEERSLP